MAKETFPQGTLAAVCNELEIIKKALADLVAVAEPIAQGADNLRDEVPDTYEIGYGLKSGHLRKLASAVERARKVL